MKKDREQWIERQDGHSAINKIDQASVVIQLYEILFAPLDKKPLPRGLVEVRSTLLESSPPRIK